MTKQELIKGYGEEIAYQRHMIENLGRWRGIFFLLMGMGLILTYFFRQSNFPLFLIGLVVSVLSAVMMFVIGYGIYRGRLNLQNVIDDFETKIDGL